MQEKQAPVSAIAQPAKPNPQDEIPTEKLPEEKRGENVGQKPAGMPGGHRKVSTTSEAKVEGENGRDKIVDANDKDAGDKAEGMVDKVEYATDKAEDADAGETSDSEITPAIQALIDEAENRGYLRGRNESIEALMQPAAGQGQPTEIPDADAMSEPLILNHIRPSIWDR